MPEHAFIDGLIAALHEDGVVTRTSTLEGLVRDKAELLDAGMPLVAAFPRSTDDVAAALRLAFEH